MTGMGVKWYRWVQTKLMLLSMVISLAIFGISYVLILNLQINYRINLRVTEINRYVVSVASDISMSQYVNGSSDYSEVESMAGFYQEARILVLNRQCNVRKDSANNRRGRTVVNDDILTALSGTAVTTVEGRYSRIAVPIRDYKKATVIGVVYVSFFLGQEYQKVLSSMDTIMTVFILTWIMLMVMIGLVLFFGFSPLRKIRKWLREVLNGHTTKPPLDNDKGEYGEIVKAVNSIITDLKEADSSRKEFVSNVSHELKTPMSAIKVLTESLLLQEGAPEEMYREFLQDINSEIDRESALINDLLSLVRLEDNKDGLNLRMISINDLAEIILKRLQPLADRKHVELVLENHAKVEAEIDEMKMTVALSNLVENGIKYNKEGGSVRVKVDSDFADAIITVSDTGCGIPEEHFGKIYQRFYRVDKTRDRATGGTGLGLAIVHQVITMHHGSINVHSKVDVGTSFVVRIPLIAVHNAITLGQKEEQE